MLLVFGSINVDLVFPAPALPRPGETVLTDSMRMVPGGKGANQAVAAARAGAEVAMVGCVGRDAFADTALAGLRAAGVALDGVATVDGATGCAAVVVGPGGENQIIVASGANRLVRAWHLPRHQLRPGTLVLLQQEVPMDENLALARRAKDAGARVALNAAPAAAPSADLLALVDMLVVNEIEAEMTAAALGLHAAGPAAAARAVAHQTGGLLILTLGCEGARAFGPAGAWRIGALDIDPVDSTGAGDVFCGYLAATIAGGGDLPGALRRASVGAGLACLVCGAQDGVPTAAEVDRRLADLAPARRID